MDDTEFLFELSRVESKLMSYAMALTQYCIDDAQELFQATVVRAYTKRALFTPGTRFYSWIERIMKNIFLNGCIDAQRNMALENVRHSDCALFSSCTDNRLEFNEVCTLICRLPSEVALPLRMYACGYKYCEIADALNLPMSSVKNRIRAARIYLKRLLDEWIYLRYGCYELLKDLVRFFKEYMPRYGYKHLCTEDDDYKYYQTLNLPCIERGFMGLHCNYGAPLKDVDV